MRTNILRSVDLALGICVCGTSQAQYGGYGAAPAYQGNGYPAPGQSGVYGPAPQNTFQQPTGYAPQGYVGQQPNAVPVHPSLQRTPMINNWNSAPPQGDGFPQQTPYRAVSDGGMQMMGDPGYLPPGPIPQPMNSQGMSYPAPAPMAAAMRPYVCQE